MSAQLIMKCLEKLSEVHETIIFLADEKTTALTKGDISYLRSILQKETALFKQLQQLEQERSRLVRFFINGKGLAIESGTLTELLPHLTEEEKEILISLQQTLREQVTLLREKNELNQQLINDSLRFVNLSLDMLQPEQDTGNYRRSNKEDDEPLGRSLFDSKA